MKIILLKNFRKLGKEGAVAEVKDGYARNYLIPQGFALVATEANFKNTESIMRSKNKIIEQDKKKISEVKEKIENISLTIPAQVKEDEKLYGTINQAQILKMLRVEGIELEKDQLTLDESIDKLGVYTLEVDLHHEIKAKLRVWVVEK